jgi:type I restriction enzyme S subunit
MGSERISTKLGDHVDIITGFPFGSKDFLDKPGIRIARGDNVKKGFFDWSDGKAKYWLGITPDLEQYLLAEGDILIGMDGSRVGENWVRVTNIDIPCLLVQRVARIRGRKSLDQRYIRFLIGNPFFAEYIKAVHTGTSIPHISVNQIKEYRIKIPPLREQKAIASILGALDDKIDLNRRMNQTLDEMAQATFKSWFVDFDPVRYKASRQAPLGLAPHIADLFPDGFETSELGEIPIGWRTSTIKENVDRISKGTTPTKSQTGEAKDESTVLYLKVKDIDDSGYINLSGLESIPRSIHEGVLKRSILKEGDVLFTIAGTIGRVAVATKELNDSNINQAIAFIRPLRSNLKSEFIRLLLTTKAIQQKTNSVIVQGVQANVSLAELGNFKFILPPKEVLRAWELTTGALARKRNLILDQTRVLIDIRDNLLPKLLSGELRIPDAERIVERCM